MQSLIRRKYKSLLGYFLVIVDKRRKEVADLENKS